MNYPFTKYFKDIFEYKDETQIEKIATKINEKYYHLLPRKFFFIKQYIDVYRMSNSIIIDFPVGMNIPNDLMKFLSDDSFYYTVFFKYFDGKGQILITNEKKGVYA